MSPARNILWTLPRKALAALLVLFVAALPVQGASGGEAQLTSARVVEVTPGKIVTASILVANPADADALYEENFTLPATWHRISPPSAPFAVRAGGREVRLIAFAVPTTSPAGSFELDYLLINSRTHAPVATATITVVVLPVVKLELIREDQTDTVIAGEAYEARLRIINRGNSRLKVMIDTLTAPACPIRLDGTEFWVGPASFHVVRAVVSSDVELRQPLTQVINFKATAAGTDGVAVVANRTVAVNIIPRITGDLDPYLRLPGKVQMTALAENGRGGAQAEFSGAGFIDEERKRSLEFLFRGPTLANRSLYGLRDEHFVSYFGPTLDVHLGDRNYSLSPLTQRFNYGRGAAADFHLGPTSAGVFYMKTLGRTRNFKTAGTYVRREFMPTFSLQANALYKSESGLAQHSTPLGLFSLEPRFHFGARLDVELEYGMSTDASGTSARAHRAQADGHLAHDVTYLLERVHAGNKFFGYYHGTESTQAALTFPIYGPLRGKASFNQDARDAYADSFIERLSPIGVVISSSRQTAYRPGLLLRVSPRTDLSLEYQNVERNATLQAGTQNSLEQSGRLGIGHSRGKFSAQTFAEFGSVQKSAPGEAGAFGGNETISRYSSFLSYRPTPRQSYSVFGNLGSSSSTVDPTERSQTIGASAQWHLSNRLDAALQYSRNQYDSRTARLQDNASGAISYTKANRNVVALQARWLKDSSSRQSSTSLTVSYTIPFGLPVSKKQNSCILRGGVFKMEGNTSRPMSGVIVTANGITAVTDRKGQFVFPSLVPGLFQVNIEQRSLGMDRITLEPVPITVEVKKGGAVELAIGVVLSSRVRIKVTIFGSAHRAIMPNGQGAIDDKFEPLGGFAGGLVELTNGKQVLRQVTDLDGEVSFESLRPGKWRLRIYENNLPEHHVIETPALEIEVEPGQSHEALVRILPKPRPIRFIEEGKIGPVTIR